QTERERDLTERERWLCQMVAHAAACALYSSEQSDAAREAADAKDSFLANVDMIDAVLPEETDVVVREAVERLRVNTCRLQTLLEELLSFAEMRAGRKAVRFECESLRAMVSELAPITRELLSGKPVSLAWEVADGADAIWTDGRKLQRVLSCLLS